MKNKGFTLVEVLTVTVILGAIAIITIPIVDNLIKNSKQKSYNAQVQNIEEAAKEWLAHNISHTPQDHGVSTTIELRTLKMNGYINLKLINPLTNQYFYDNTYVTITKRYENYTYEVNISDEPDSEDQIYSDNYELLPTISLNGVLPLTTISLGSSYTVSINNIHATAKDAKTITNITIEITKNGIVVPSINTDAAATYIVTYKAYDNDGLSATIKRVVIVA